MAAFFGVEQSRVLIEGITAASPPAQVAAVNAALVDKAKSDVKTAAAKKRVARACQGFKTAAERTDCKSAVGALQEPAWLPAPARAPRELTAESAVLIAADDGSTVLFTGGSERPGVSDPDDWRSGMQCVNTHDSTGSTPAEVAGGLGEPNTKAGCSTWCATRARALGYQQGFCCTFDHRKNGMTGTHKTCSLSEDGLVSAYQVFGLGSTGIEIIRGFYPPPHPPPCLSGCLDVAVTVDYTSAAAARQGAAKWWAAKPKYVDALTHTKVDDLYEPRVTSEAEVETASPQQAAAPTRWGDFMHDSGTS